MVRSRFKPSSGVQILSEGFVKYHPCPDPGCIYNVPAGSFLPDPLFFRYSFHSYPGNASNTKHRASLPGELPRDATPVGQVLLCPTGMAQEASD